MRYSLLAAILAVIASVLLLVGVLVRRDSPSFTTAYITTALFVAACLLGLVGFGFVLVAAFL